MRYREWCDASSFFSRRPSLKNERSLNDLNAISNPQGVNREVFIVKSLKILGFGRVLNYICMKNLGKIYITTQVNLPTTWTLWLAWVVLSAWALRLAWAISNPQGVNREVFIVKSLKILGFGRVLNYICMKNLGKIYTMTQANLPTTWTLWLSWVVLSAWALQAAWAILLSFKSQL